MKLITNTKTSDFIQKHCCGNNLPLCTQKPKLVAMVKNLELERDKAITNFVYLNKVNTNLKSQCKWMFVLLVVFSLVIIFR